MVSMIMQKINSLTKSPRISTFHKQGNTGTLTDEYTVSFGIHEPVYCSEYVIGVNCRIAFLDSDMFPNNFVVGDTQQLLGDRYNKFGTADRSSVFPYLQKLGNDLLTKKDQFTIPKGGACVFYFVLHGKHGKGHNKKQWKRYTKTHKNGHLLTNFCTISNAEYLLETKSKDYFSLWREKQRGQAFLTPRELGDFATMLGIKTVPQLLTLKGPEVNVSVAEMYGFVKGILPTTLAALDDEAATEQPYGITLQDEDGFAVAHVPINIYKDTLIKKGLLTEETDAK